MISGTISKIKIRKVFHNMQQDSNHAAKFILKFFQGMLIGLGAVLPGISGGVLCVVFGIYKTIMEFLADPFHTYKTHLPGLMPVIIGGAAGFLGIANILSFFLEKYPAPSICVFVGLITGMLPSLFREAEKEGRTSTSYFSMCMAMLVVFVLLISLKLFSVAIEPGFLWYLFCGFCLALSVIAPGMSFSTLLMPLGLYEPFVAGIGKLDFQILVPAGIGAVFTIILLAKLVNTLFEKHYSVAFHVIVGIVIAATLMIIPFDSFISSPIDFVRNSICLMAGIIAALKLDAFNMKYEV